MQVRSPVLTIGSLAAMSLGVAVGLMGYSVAIAVLAGVVGSGLFIFLIRHPAWGVFLAFCSAMIYYSWSVGAFVISPIRIFGLLAVWLWMVVLIVQPGALTRLLLVTLRNRIVVVTLLLLGIGLLTYALGYLKFPEATHSPDIRYPQSRSVGLLVSCVVLFVSTVNLIDSSSKVHALLHVMAFASVVGLLYALIKSPSAANNWYFLDSLGLSRAVRVRITQWYQVLLPFLVVWFLSARTRLARKVLIGGALSLLVLGMLLSASRANFISLAIQSLMVWFWYPKRLGVRSPSVVLGLGVVIALILLAVLPFVPVRFSHISLARLEDAILGDAGRAGEPSGRLPVYLNIASIYVRDLNWLTGIGFGHFEGVYNYHYRYASRTPGYWTDSHSLVLTLLLEMGILGGVILLMLVFGVTRSLKESLYLGRRLRDRRLYELSVASVGSVLSLLPTLLFQGNVLLDRVLYFILAVISIVRIVTARQFEYENPGTCPSTCK